MSIPCHDGERVRRNSKHGKLGGGGRDSLNQFLRYVSVTTFSERLLGILMVIDMHKNTIRFKLRVFRCCYLI